MEASDPRIFEFLTNFHNRGWGGMGYRREEDSEDEEGSIILDSLGNGSIGKCVAQWTVRGINGKTKIERALEGLKLVINSPDEVDVDVVPLREVMRSRVNFKSRKISVSRRISFQMPD